MESHGTSTVVHVEVDLPGAIRAFQADQTIQERVQNRDRDSVKET